MEKGGKYQERRQRCKLMSKCKNWPKYHIKEFGVYPVGRTESLGVFQHGKDMVTSGFWRDHSSIAWIAWIETENRIEQVQIQEIVGDLSQ